MLSLQRLTPLKSLDSGGFKAMAIGIGVFRIRRGRDVFLISFIKYANNENAVLFFLFHFVFVHKSVKFVGSLIAGTFLLNKLEGKSEKK